MANQELTVAELIRLAAPYTIKIITDPFPETHDVKIEIRSDDRCITHVVSRVVMEDLRMPQYMRELIELMKRQLERGIDKHKLDSLPYEPVCPRGYPDCIRDPAYIKHHQPHLYSQLYGDVDPTEATHQRDGCCEQMYRDPEEKHYCYDPEAT